MKCFIQDLSDCIHFFIWGSSRSICVSKILKFPTLDSLYVLVLWTHSFLLQSKMGNLLAPTNDWLLSEDTGSFPLSVQMATHQWVCPCNL